MKDKREVLNIKDNDANALANWHSTYGQLTVERLLERFNITIEPDNLLNAIKNPHSFYFQIMHVPYANLLNGLIVDQAYEYQVYAQKLFIDFLLSGKNDEPEDSPGSNARDELTNERINLMTVIESFNSQQLAQKKLIAESQAVLIKIAKQYNDFLNSVVKSDFFHTLGINTQDATKIIEILLSNALEDQSISEEVWSKTSKVSKEPFSDTQRVELLNIINPLLSLTTQIKDLKKPFIEQAEYLGKVFREFRNDFYQLIIKTNELIQLLPSYKPNPQRDLQNRESIDFDPIG